MQELFMNILKSSLHGSLVILAVIALRFALKKAPKSVFCLLWLLAGLRLMMPFEIESRFSLQPAYENVTQKTVQQREEPQISSDYSGGREQIPDAEGETLVQPQLPAVTEPQTQMQAQTQTSAAPAWNWQHILPWIWLMGVAVLICSGIVSYLKLKKQVREAIRMDDGCWECPGLETAFVLGFLPPKIYLPTGLPEGDRQFIFDHENTHIVRHDHWWKLLGYGVLSIHWFNPLAWVAYSLLCRDIELACDEHVVRYMSVEQRKAYSSALLGCSSRHASIAACPVAFGESNPKQRILSVLNYRKPSFWISLIAVIAVAFVVVCLMTSPRTNSLMNVWNVPFGEENVGMLLSGNRLVNISSGAEVKELTDILKTVTCDPDTPVDIPEGYAAHALGVSRLDPETSSYISHVYLYFSEDFSLVWSEEGEGAYPVEAPGVLLDYFSVMTEGIRDRETSGEPFATISQPQAWVRGISTEAISRAEIYLQSASVREGNTISSSSTSGIYAARKFDELIAVLNTMPETAVVSEKTLERDTYSDLRTQFGSKGGMSVTLRDDVNQLVVILRLLANDTVQLVMIDELEKIEESNLYLDHPRCWIIEDDTLLTFLNQLQEDPPIISYTLIREQLLLRECQVALRNFQGQLYYSIKIDRSFNGDALNSGSTQFYYGWGDDWLRYGVASNADFCDEDWYLYKTGQKYSRYLDTVYHPGNGEGRDTGWVKGFQQGEGQVGEPWLKTFQWVDKDITFIEERTEGDYQLITISVQGSPYDDALTNVSQYQVTFVFDTGNNLCQVLKNYTETYAMVSNGEEDIGITQVSTTIQILDDTQEEIVDTIQKYTEEAVRGLDVSQGTETICIDPNCTDESHGHNQH